jgi:Chaperone of endosialidase
MKTTTLPLRYFMNRSPLRAFLLIPLVLACIALSPQARAVCKEGCLTNQNTVLGDDALLNNTGNENTAIGFQALLSNTSGEANTAIGLAALESNTTGGFNTATGWSALGLNQIGFGNTAMGVLALTANTTSNNNTAIGADALQNNNADNNTANGSYALYSNTTGNGNTASGFSALLLNTTGSNNIALGASAGYNLTGGNSNIDIGNAGVAGDSRTIRIGTKPTHRNTYIAGISGVTVANGVGVMIDTNGHLGTVASSARFKTEIKSMDKGSEAILALKPVTFRYKKELDPDGIPQFGLVAEEVEKVNPALVARDDQGKAYTVRYEAVNAMLLNEFLKEHKKVAELEATVSKLKAQEKEIAELKAALKQQAAQIQKVSAQLEASVRAQQTVVSNP